ncbi:apolipophorins-like [Strongylocentrotus purpuratus]|uniref:VWFD domain-containing protein n=1 Tax=Strongylocentrotus purpuratus TaxID=7668 RepID=A0A7M7PIC5_STRPU|nr:apolipophorins-like [Strongylocentrotus purpuratus]
MEKKEEILTRWQEEIKPKINEMITNLTRFVKDPELLTNLKQMAIHFKTETLPELKRVLLEEKFPELKRIIMEEKYPEIKRQVLAQYEIAKVIMEELKQNATHFRENVMAKVETLKIKATEKWTELLEKIKGIKQNWPETYQKIKDDIEDLKLQLKTKLSKYINKVLAVLKELRIPVEILPLEQMKVYSPWKYTAMVFRTNHMMTFDGKVYSVPEFGSEQQTYVLAHDFVDSNFTLLVQKKRITLVVRNMSIAIDDENVVHINGLPTLQELPYQTPISKELTIMAKGPWVNVTSTKGIALSCHLEMFPCIFHLSGWYHGKSRGLLGNLDTEHHNEFILPEGGITTDLAEFISAYDVSPHTSRNVIPSRLGSCRSTSEKCREMFLDEDSTLNATFQDINQEEFYNFCVEETRKCNPTCEVTNPVVRLGKDLQRNVDYDPECFDCTVGEVNQENVRSTSSADIIFVVSETAAMAEDNVIKSSIKTSIRNMKSVLNTHEVQDVKYGIAAYGGSDILGRPHVHTLCGHLMESSVDCASSGIDSLVFKGARPVDAMGAIQLAASYPFRKEAAKIIILIADEDLMEESTNRFEYYFQINNSRVAIQKSLARQGITFNVFSSYPTLNKKSTDSPILGVNYLGKQIINKKNSGEEGINRLAIPSGQYAKLAKATRGSVMGLHWLQTEHRDLSTLLPRMVYQQIQPQATGQVDFICRCVIGMYGEARNECQISRFIDIQM